MTTKDSVFLPVPTGPMDGVQRVRDYRFRDYFLKLSIMILLVWLPFCASPVRSQDVIMLQAGKGTLIVDRKKISCNPLTTSKVGITAWGLWSFNKDVAEFSCGPERRVDSFRITVRPVMPFSQVMLNSKGKHIRTLGRLNYYEYPILGKQIEELIVFVGEDGNQVVITRPKEHSAAYIAYRQIGENVELSYGARRTSRDDVLWENDRKILAFVKSIVRIE